MLFYINVPFSRSNIQVPEPARHVCGRRRGGSGLHGFGVGGREQGHHQEFQKEEPHFVCRRGDGHQLLSALAVRWCHGLHLWNHLPSAL